MVSFSTIFKALVASLFLSSAMGRRLRQTTPADITFVNNCGHDVKILKYAVMDDGVFKCNINDPEDTITITPGTFTVAGWGTFQSYMDNSVATYDALGNPLGHTSFADMKYMSATCEEDPPEVGFVAVSGNVYLCSTETPTTPETPATDAPATDSTVVDCSTLPPVTRKNCEIDQATQKAANAPTPFVVRTITVENQCANAIAVGNLFKTSDSASSYDVRCADYITLATGESVYMEIPIDPETGYLSVWDTVNQKTPFNASKLSGLSTGAHLGEMIDSSKEHPGCDNQLKGNDIWYSYTIENDIVTVSC
ncbi:hypothetical protein ATCVTN60342_182L [Acanthocystis turfacea Chlorella virus TN603.4.2]|nr:hypothetical protein ATCVTN60342_182L [Acanthocystis turfacea Chlorella virus TN603.4.2]